MMGEILFISHRIPFPPDRGDKIRSSHILRRLVQLAPVHVATFADDALDMAEEVELAAITHSYRLVRRAKPLILAGGQALLSGKPVSLTAFYDADLAAYVKEVIDTRPISVIYIFSGQMGQYVPEDYTGRLVVDFVDVDSAKFEDYGARRGGPMGWVERRESHRLGAEEERLATRADVSLFVSGPEAELFRSRLSGQARQQADVRVLQNGIDTTGFDPGLIEPEPRMLETPGPRLIFTGQMDYAPNIEAAVRAVDRIMPLIRKEYPEATFHIVGRNPKEDLLQREGRNGCYVWGRVDDIKTWLKAADLALIPLEIARGVQNKVLEAMAMTVPVVATLGAGTGTSAANGEHFLLADSDEELAKAAIRLLNDRVAAERMGQAARQLLVRTASWSSSLAPLPEMMGFAAAPAHEAF